MRIWIGKEMEGPCKGQETIFVESSKVINSKKLIDIIKKYYPFQRLFLGAGRKAFPGFDDEDAIIKYCYLQKINIVIETSIFNLQNISKSLLLYSSVVISIYDDKLSCKDLKKHNILFKIDDFKQVNIYELKKIYTTNLSTLNKGLYKNIDKILYEEREE